MRLRAPRIVARSTTAVVTASLALAAFGVAAVPLIGTAGTAQAAPCGTNANGSSLPFLDTGSIGGSVGGSLAPPDKSQGPQGPVPFFNNGITKVISWVTGPRSDNKTLERFGISGTDLGIAWDNGAGQTLLAFGDTFGNCSVQGRQWRHNVLLRTNDNDLSDGLSVPFGVPGDITSGTSGASVTASAPRYATQMIGAIGFSGVEVTTIPTTAIAIDGKQYINYMSVRSWGSSGSWITNFSATAVSADNGQTWTTPLNTIRVNSPVTVPAPVGWPSINVNDSKFQQGAYVAGQGADAGWIYQFGTPNGRFGATYLARFAPADILDLTKYQYWTGTGWSSSIDDLAAGNPRVIPAPVSELSVAWSPYLNKYLMLDTGALGVHLRTADHPEGPWSGFRVILPSTVGLYGPMMLPQSPALKGTGPDLYFNGSRWDDYNVALVRSRLPR